MVRCYHNWMYQTETEPWEQKRLRKLHSLPPRPPPPTLSLSSVSVSHMHTYTQSHQFSSVARSCLTLCNPMDSSTTRPSCPSPTPGVHPNPCPSSRWCHPIISSSVVPFSSCPQSFPASGSFPLSQFFTSGGQCIRASASASVLPMNIQDCFLSVIREIEFGAPTAHGWGSSQLNLNVQPQLASWLCTKSSKIQPRVKGLPKADNILWTYWNKMFRTWWKKMIIHPGQWDIWMG